MRCFNRNVGYFYKECKIKIQAITNVNNASYQNKKVNNNINRPTFQGWVNGNYYKDEIIELAKKYRFSSTWKSEMREGKESIDHAIANWHGGGEDDTACRVITAITSFGLSELIMDTASGIGAAVNNKKIENMINEITKCIDDLNKGCPPIR